MAKSKVKTQDKRHCPVCGEKFTEQEIKDYQDFSCFPSDEMPLWCTACGEDIATNTD